MSWFDFLLAALVAALTVVGAQRKLTGLLIGVGSLILLRFLLVVFEQSAGVGMVFALGGGLLSGMVGRSFIHTKRGASATATVFGGLGGFTLGALLAALTVTSLPIETNANNQLVYPPANLPLGMGPAVSKSQLALLGRDILLYPLLVEDEVIEPNSVLGGLHRFLVVGVPWERRLDVSKRTREAQALNIR